MDSFPLISLSEPLAFPLLLAHVTPHLICGDVFGVVCVREAENKSSVRYEVIAGIISIVNQEVQWRGSGGEGCGKEEGRGGKRGRIKKKRMKGERGGGGLLFVILLHLESSWGEVGVKPSKGRNEERKEGRRNYDDVFKYLEKERLPARKHLSFYCKQHRQLRQACCRFFSNQFAACLPLRANQGLVLLPLLILFVDYQKTKKERFKDDKLKWKQDYKNTKNHQRSTWKPQSTQSWNQKHLQL